MQIKNENKSSQKHLARLIMNRDSDINSDICYLTTMNQYPSKLSELGTVFMRIEHHIGRHTKWRQSIAYRW